MVAGVRSRFGRATAVAPDGTELTAEYPSLTRPALAAAFAVEVRSDRGFDGPIELAISRQWIEAWDTNGWLPEPDAGTGDDRWVTYEFEAPEGDTFRAFHDARMEPARQEDVRGVVQLRSSGRPIAEVRLTTKVRP